MFNHINRSELCLYGGKAKVVACPEFGLAVEAKFDHALLILMASFRSLGVGVNDKLKSSLNASNTNGRSLP